MEFRCKYRYALYDDNLMNRVCYYNRRVVRIILILERIHKQFPDIKLNMYSNKKKRMLNKEIRGENI